MKESKKKLIEHLTEALKYLGPNEEIVKTEIINAIKVVNELD